MSEYIDKDALIKTTEETPFTMSQFLNKDQCDGANMARRTFAMIFRILPASDVAPVKHGRWIEYRQGRWTYAKCSKCETVHDVMTNYCPNCGAKMDGGADDDDN